ELFWIIRLSIILVTIFALIVGLDPASSVLNLVSYAWAGFAAAFGPAVLLSVFWKGTTRNGVLAGISTGGATVILWSMLTNAGIIPFLLYEIVPGFLFATIAIVFFSIFGPQPTAEMTREFELVQENR